jgi:hypothetical protein
MLVLCESLKLVRGLKYYESDEYTMFHLPRSVIQPYILIRQSRSFKELLQIASSISNPQLEQIHTKLMNLIKDICSRNLTIQNGKEKLLEEIYLYYNNYKEIEELGKESEKLLPVISNNLRHKAKTYRNSKSKSKRERQKTKNPYCS